MWRLGFEISRKTISEWTIASWSLRRCYNRARGRISSPERLWPIIPGVPALTSSDEPGSLPTGLQISTQNVCAANLVAHFEAYVNSLISPLAGRGLQSVIIVPGRANGFLIGATGFLGSEILKQLLRLDRVASIAALVRAEGWKDGMNRVRVATQVYRETATSRIVDGICCCAASRYGR